MSFPYNIIYNMFSIKSNNLIVVPTFIVNYCLESLMFLYLIYRLAICINNYGENLQKYHIINKENIIRIIIPLIILSISKCVMSSIRLVCFIKKFEYSIYLLLPFSEICNESLNIFSYSLLIKDGYSNFQKILLYFIPFIAGKVISLATFTGVKMFQISRNGFYLRPLQVWNECYSQFYFMYKSSEYSITIITYTILMIVVNIKKDVNWISLIILVSLLSGFSLLIIIVYLPSVCYLMMTSYSFETSPSGYNRLIMFYEKLSILSLYLILLFNMSGIFITSILCVVKQFQIKIISF